MFTWSLFLYSVCMIELLTMGLALGRSPILSLRTFVIVVKGMHVATTPDSLFHRARILYKAPTTAAIFHILSVVTRSAVIYYLHRYLGIANLLLGSLYTLSSSLFIGQSSKGFRRCETRPVCGQFHFIIFVMSYIFLFWATHNIHWRADSNNAPPGVFSSKPSKARSR